MTDNLGNDLANLGLSIETASGSVVPGGKWWCLGGCEGNGCYGAFKNINYCPDGTCSRASANWLPPTPVCHYGTLNYDNQA